jgi:hypothetical protein
MSINSPAYHIYTWNSTIKSHSNALSGVGGCGGGDRGSNQTNVQCKAIWNPLCVMHKS